MYTMRCRCCISLSGTCLEFIRTMHAHRPSSFYNTRRHMPCRAGYMSAYVCLSPSLRSSFPPPLVAFWFCVLYSSQTAGRPCRRACTLRLCRSIDVAAWRAARSSMGTPGRRATRALGRRRPSFALRAAGSRSSSWVERVSMLGNKDRIHTIEMIHRVRSFNLRNRSPAPARKPRVRRAPVVAAWPSWPRWGSRSSGTRSPRTG